MKRLAIVLNEATSSQMELRDKHDTICVWEDDCTWSIQFYGIRIVALGRKGSDHKKDDTLTLPWGSILYFEVSELGTWEDNGDGSSRPRIFG